MPLFAPDTPITINAVLFPNVDQMDFTGPFEIFCRLPNTTINILAETLEPVIDSHGLALTPTMAFAEAPGPDLLIIPGGPGVDAQMENENTLEFLRRQAKAAKRVMTVCTGQLLAGAAGLLKGRRATTHWAAHKLIPLFGAIPVDKRVVVDDAYISTAGVTAGFDGSLLVAAMLRGETIAKTIQLQIEYAPDPPFNCGSPESADPEILHSIQRRFGPAFQKTAERLQTLSELQK